MKNAVCAMFRIPIIPKMILSPEAIKNKIIPYAIPCIPWDMYIDTVGSIDISFTDLNSVTRPRSLMDGWSRWKQHLTKITDGEL